MAVEKIRIQQVGIVLPVPAIKIREIRSEIRDVEVTVITDKVIIQGIVHKQIFFVDENNVVRHLAEDVPFSTFLDIPGALPGMEAQVNVIVEFIRAELSEDGTELSQVLILQVFAKVVDEVQLTVALDPEGPLVKAEIVIGETVSQIMLSNEVELEFPAIKVDEIVAEIRNLTTEVIPDKVVIQGILHKQVFYVDIEGIGRHIPEDIPFNTFLDIPGALPGDNVQINVVIEAINATLDETGTILTQEIVLEIFGKVHRSEQVNIAIDEEGPLFRVPVVIGENTKQDLLVNDFLLPVPAIKVREIVASFRNLSTIVINNKVIVQGTLHKQIFFVDEENIERHQAEDIPFSSFLDVPGAEPGDLVDFNPVIEEIIFALRNGTVVHQKVAVEYFIKVTRLQQLNIVPGEDALLKIEEVIGENTRQIIIPGQPPDGNGGVLPITVARAVIRSGVEEKTSAERTVENSFDIPFEVPDPVTVEHRLEDTGFERVDDTVRVFGKIITTVIDDNGVLEENELDYDFILDEIQLAVNEELVDVEHDLDRIVFEVIEEEGIVEQEITIRFTVYFIRYVQTQVITDVDGPGIVTTEVTINAEVVIVPVTPPGEEPGLQTFGPELVESTVELAPPADEIEEITAFIDNVTATAEDGGVRFTGEIVKEISYTVGANEFETTEVIIFDLFFPAANVEAGFDVPELIAEITDILFELSEDGSELTQQIFLTFQFKVTDQQVITVVTSVSGPGIGAVETEILFLDIVGDGEGPVPVEVVTDVEII